VHPLPPWKCNVITSVVDQLRVVLLAMAVVLPGRQSAIGNAQGLYRVDLAGIGSCYDADLSLMLSAHVFAYLEPGTLEVSFPHPPMGISPRERVSLLGDFGAGFSAGASKYILEAVLGKNVLLAFDSAARDASGALLAYVYLPEDGSCVNVTLIRTGLARVAPDVTFQFRSEFETYQQQAREKRRGTWQQ